MMIVNIVHNEGHLKQVLRYFPGGAVKYGEVTKTVATAQEIALKLKMLGFATVIHKFKPPGNDFYVFQVYRSTKKAPPGGLWRDAGRFGIPTKKRKTNMTIARKKISRR